LASMVSDPTIRQERFARLHCRMLISVFECDVLNKSRLRWCDVFIDT